MASQRDTGQKDFGQLARSLVSQMAGEESTESIEEASHTVTERLGAMGNAMSDMVVVWVRPQFEIDEETGFVIGCFPELNLYAHGSNQNAALAGLASHFRHFIEALRSTGELEDRLDSSGLEWMSYDEAVALGVDVINLRSGSTPALEPESEPSENALTLMPAA
ncbi:MAG: hypothetical protein OXO54_00065 [Chloroflexota bacterium]|nr:hypothetical protein [Chloroflexota bacterium]